MWTNPHLTGLLPVIITPHDPRSAEEQLNDRYGHGGGCMKLDNFWYTQLSSGDYVLHYPHDDDLAMVARCVLPASGEICVLFDCALLLVIDSDEDRYYVTRVD